MKLLVIFVSALVLVAHAKVLSAPEGLEEFALEGEQQPGVYTVEEAIDGVVQDMYAVEESEPEGVRVFGAEELQSPTEQVESGFQQFEADLERMEADGVNVPITTRACTNSACLNICNRLGFKHGVCLSATTCQCSN